jgi:DNA (cytosine-5)-methyltransferase 1
VGGFGMTFIDWFAGAGGFTKAMTKAGHKCIGYCEIDKFALKSYQAIHNPKEGELIGADIRNVQPERVPDADFYCFGWPCQDNSIAGKRRGQTEGTRSGLLFEITRIIRVKKPSYFVAENVAGLFSVNDGRDFYQTIRLFADLGYDVQWQLLNTVWFLPQNRERIYFVGHLRGLPRPEVFPIIPANREITCAIKQPIFKWGNSEIGVVIDDVCPALKSSEGGGIRKRPCIPVLTPDRSEKRQNDRRFKEPGEPTFTLTAQDIHGVMVVGMLDGKGHDQIRRVYDPAQISPSLCVNGGGNQEPKILQRARGNNPGGIFETAPTLSKSSYEHNNHLVDGYAIRKLTPLECWRLQGWDDKDFYKAKVVNSDSQLYKQAGNGISIPCAYEIGIRLGDVCNA